MACLLCGPNLSQLSEGSRTEQTYVVRARRYSVEVVRAVQVWWTVLWVGDCTQSFVQQTVVITVSEFIKPLRLKLVVCCKLWGRKLFVRSQLCEVKLFVRHQLRDSWILRPPSGLWMLSYLFDVSHLYAESLFVISLSGWVLHPPSIFWRLSRLSPSVVKAESLVRHLPCGRSDVVRRQPCEGGIVCLPSSRVVAESLFVADSRRGAVMSPSVFRSFDGRWGSLLPDSCLVSWSVATPETSLSICRRAQSSTDSCFLLGVMDSRYPETSLSV